MHILLSEVWHSTTTVMMSTLLKYKLINYCEFYLLVQVLFLYFVITFCGHFYHSFTPLLCNHTGLLSMH